MTSEVVPMRREPELRIATGLSLPLNAVTQTFAILARKGAGKTYTGAVMTEEMAKAGLRVVVLDPLGVFWGLRAAANGKDEGLPVTILGGEHGDLPLEATAGKLVADLVVEHEGSFVLDLSGFESNAAQDRFVADFADRLYRAKTEDRRPLHLMIDEADAFAPQRPMPGQQRMLGAIEAIVRRGRIRGLGVTLITQRPAVLNKNVLTQAECLITLQMTAPQDRAAIDEWVRGNGTKEQRDQLVDSLASLQRGQAWFWSPAWLQIFTRVQVRKRETFDSSKTPEAGVTVVEPKRLAEVQIEQFKARMAETIERAKADDPKVLRKRIADLERETLDLKRHLAQPAAPAASPNTALLKKLQKGIQDAMKFIVSVKAADFTTSEDDQAALRRAVEKAMEQVSAAFEQRLKQPLAAVDRLKRDGDRLEQLFASLLGAEVAVDVDVIKREPFSVAPRAVAADRAVQAPRVSRSDAPVPPSDLTGPEFKILTCLAELEALGFSPADKIQLGLMAGYTNVRSGGFSEPLARLGARGYVTSPQSGKVAITDVGRHHAGAVQAPKTPEEMQARVMEKLTGPEQRLLRVLIKHYPKALAKQALGEQCGYSNIRSGGFSEPLARLNTLGLTESPARGEISASRMLFLEA